MKYIAQVVYPEFVELFNLNLDEGNLDIELASILSKPKQDKDILTLDLSTDIKECYSVFRNKAGDLTIMQIHNQFVVSYYLDNDQHWFKFESNDLIRFLFDDDITAKLIPYLDEDKEILLNSLFSDLIRNDFSFSDINKKVKFLKVALLLSFIHKNLENISYSRVIFDETVLGDIELDQIPMAFRYSNATFLKLAKINSTSKMLALLEKNEIIKKKFEFIENTFFVNKPKSGEKIKLLFGDSGVKFDYQVLPSKNYTFDLDNKEYLLNVGNLFKETVRGKVFVYNGDDTDLMLG